MKRIALITHELGGGVGTMTRFLNRVIRESGRFTADAFLLSTSVTDPASPHLGNPRTWRSGVRVVPERAGDISYRRIGAWFSELEFQRYRPREPLTKLLESYDILQFVAGTAAWVRVASGLRRPIGLWTATTILGDRSCKLSAAPPMRRLWYRIMIAHAKLAENWGLRHADVIFALSAYTKDAIRAKGRNESVVVAPCGVDTDMFRPTEHKPYNYIFGVCRPSDPRKNISLLLRAYADIKSAFTACPELWLAGERPNDAILSLASELRVTPHVRWLGLKQAEELAHIYRGARLFVLASNEEGLGIVLLEAMASGLPVVSTACGGPCSIVEHGKTGLLTPVAERQSLAQAIGTLLQDQNRACQMGKLARELAVQHYSLKIAGQVFLSGLAHLAAKT